MSRSNILLLELELNEDTKLSMLTQVNVFDVFYQPTNWSIIRPIRDVNICCVFGNGHLSYNLLQTTLKVNKKNQTHKHKTFYFSILWIFKLFISQTNRDVVRHVNDSVPFYVHIQKVTQGYQAAGM